MKIIGVVARNQKRKLFPDLLKTFSLYLSKADKDLARKSFLYLHTSYPDLGWDIPRLIKENGLSHKVLFTYLCHNCNASFPSFWQDTTCICPKCVQATARLPNVQIGINNESLAYIYNCFDVYLQLANREGLGIPAIEAASCGVPIVALDYAGPEDFKNKLAAISSPPIALNRESETHQYNASPNIEDIATKLVEVMSLSEKDRRKLGYEARKGVIKHYQWESSVKVLKDEIDKLEGNWTSQPKIHQPNMNEPQGLSDKEFMQWAFIHILGQPEKIGSYEYWNMFRNLNTGFAAQYGEPYINEDSMLSVFQNARQNMGSYKRENIKEELRKMCETRNEWEAKRCGMIPYEMPQWMQVSLSK